MTGVADPAWRAGTHREPWPTGPDDDWHTGQQPAASQPGASPGGWEWLAARSAPPAPPFPQPASLPPAAPLPQPMPAPRPPEPAQPRQPAPSGQPAPGPSHARKPAGPAGGDEAWAMLGYLGVPFLSVLVPLAVYLIRARRSAFVRQHAAQALNLAVTVLLYNVCVLILAGILALDAVSVALLVAGPVALALWLAALYFLTKAAIKASRGGFYPLPRWICATIAR